MNPRKVRNSWFVVCLSVFLCFSWSAQGADRVKKGGVLVKTPTSPLPLPPGYTPPVAAPLQAGASPKLKATVVSPNFVRVEWGVAAGASDYTVWQAAVNTGPFFVIGTVVGGDPDRSTLLVAGQPPNSTRFYKVSANYPKLSPGVSVVVSATTPPANNPSGFTATAGAGGDVILMWNPVPTAINYILWGAGISPGATRPGTPVVPSVRVSGTTYTVKGLPPGTHSWSLFTNYYSPTGEYFVESNPARTSYTPPIWGYADIHNHQFANLGFGGRIFTGKPFDPGGISKALPRCDFINGNLLEPIHGPEGTWDLIGGVAGQNLPHGTNGYPNFDGWPRWNSTTHQQVYVDWLERAHRGGLSLMVMLAVNNEVLCSLALHPNRSCGDMEAVDLQLAAAKDLEMFVDQKMGGPGLGWYRIVRSPQEARNAIAKGQLAVVLGIEVDNLFGCRAGASCGDVSVPLQNYYNLGVRHVFPIHLANNGFGGTAVYDDTFNWLNAVLTGSFVDVESCGSKGVQFKFGLSSTANDAFTIFVKSRFQLSTPYPTYPNDGQCNKVGLTAQGKNLVRELMKRHMIIDIDHMSMHAFEDTLSIAEEPQNLYPLASGHNGIMEVSRGEKRAEGQKTLNQLNRIRNLGGLVALHTNQGKTETSGNGNGIASFGEPTILNDCSHSSKTYAQAYQFAVSALGGPTQAAVAFGTDFNGLSGEPGPRFGNPQLGIEACPGGSTAEKNAQLNTSISRRVIYPFTLPGMGAMPKGQSGKKVFDINEDGLAHIGLLPDFIEDLRKIRVTDEQLKPLFRSAEAYITMWEKTYAIH